MEQPPPEEAYRPRAHDHLVEPFYGGLGAEREASGAGDGQGPAERERGPRGALARLLGWLRPRSGRGPRRDRR